MRLVSVHIEDYKRFSNKARLLVDGEVTALVGPNEAGKSAVLEVLAHFEAEDDPFPNHVLTRGAALANDDVIVELLFKLEDADFEDNYPPLAEKPTWFELHQQRDGGIKRMVKPSVPRSRELRPQAEAAATELLADAKKMLEQRPDKEEPEEEGPEEEVEVDPLERLVEAIEEVQGQVDVDKDDLDTELKSLLTEISDLLDSEEVGLEMERPEARAEFTAAARYETGDYLAELAAFLETKRPRFLLIHEHSRELAGSYPIAEIEAGGEFPALHNLAMMGGIEIQQYIDASRATSPEAKNFEQRASKAITERLSEAWDQVDEVRIDFEIYNGETLGVLVSTAGEDGFRAADERSAGMRAFIAVVAAIDAAAADGEPVILLLEHPEHDLHIDAQGDLIRVLEEQQVAQQVVYTTHSPAALPTDIAANTRAVVPEEPGVAGDRSRIAATFAEDDAGLAPLLLVMGAGTAAFSRARSAVIGEGLTEIYLLPPIFREVMGLDVIEFQVAAGGAHMDEDMAREVNSDAAHVAFLVDGDDGGKDNARVIKRAGVNPEHIVVVGGEDSGLTLEDVLEEGLYVDAVNAELALKAFDFELSAEDLDPEKGRVLSVKELCEAKSATAPEKPAVARRCLELSQQETEEYPDGRPLIGAEHQGTVRTIYDQLAEILKLE